MIGIDNRCSGCITHVRSDIPGALKQCNKAIKGFGGAKTYEVWTGTIHWDWEDDQGKIHTMVIPNSYYVPEGKVRLLSPQHWAQTRKSSEKRGGAGEMTTGTEVVLFWNDRQSRRTIQIDTHGNNVATFHLASGYKQYHAYCKECGTERDRNYDKDPLLQHQAMPSMVISDDEGEDDETTYPIQAQQWHQAIPKPTVKATPDAATQQTDEAEPRKFDFDLDGKTATDEIPPPDIIPHEEEERPTAEAELLRYHYDFGHLPFAKLQQMARDGILPKRLANCHVPVCSACTFAKATKRAWRTRSSKDWSNKTPPSKPGMVVSVDQLVSPTPGLVAQMTGFITKQRYRYATVYVDQATSLGFVFLQKTSTVEETLQGKRAFERYAINRGVSVRAYHADNGIFKAHGWVKACHDQGQDLTFAAVGAHHSSGKAERRIRELQGMARTMLLHANKRWPQAITANLWPYAVRHANDCINAAPNMQHETKQSPIQLFSQTAINTNKKHWRPFGCPVYVLDERLQGNKPHNKWENRARVGIYLGQSPIHNRNVALVLNRHTGHVSPQFHVRFDRSFHTLQQEQLTATWQVSTFFADAKRTGQPQRSQNGKRRRRHKGQEGAPQNTPTGTPPEEGQQQLPNNTWPDEAPNQSPTTGPPGGTPPQTTQTGRTMERMPPVDSEGAHGQRERQPPQTTTTNQTRTRSGRLRKPTQRLIEVMSAEVEDGVTIPGELFALSTLTPQDDMEGEDPLLAYKAAVSDPDTMYHHEAMKEPDRAEFIKGMQKEMERQMEDGNLSIVRRDSVPAGQRIFKAVWQMRRKRDIMTREIKTHKERLNFDGSKMEKGIDYDQTYAPVASWASIRLVLALVSAFNWHTQQIDYVLAYPQAPVEREVYMEIPVGYDLDEGKSKRDYVLKLHANLYGQKQAGRVWYQHLSRRLVEQVGFTKSAVDECVFYRGQVIYVLYTDDSIIVGPDQAEIDKAINDIQAAKLNITVEGNIKDFLGVNIHKSDNGEITFSQPHLIDKVLKGLRLGSDTVPKNTPAAPSKILHRHLEKPPFDNNFNYRSIVGMLNYIEAGSRSDIAYATHQCARFASNPRKPHGDAVRWIGRYLYATRDKGMSFRPDKEAGLEVWVDADFAGNWKREDATTDRDTARSRHGYIIRYMGCPVIWKSQIQTEIALSSTESEYTGLSYALRAAIPIMRLLEEMQQQGIQIQQTQAEVHCKVFEDNSGALEMAKVYKFRPRTKHLNVKLHHFRTYVEDGSVTIHKVATEDQLADYLTKPLPQDTLERLRKRVLGW